MTESPLLRRVLWALTAVCLVVAVLAAVQTAGSDDGDDTAGGDGASADGTNGDGANGDGSGDGSSGDGTDGDGSNGDGSNGDGTNGDNGDGDGTNGDNGNGDGSESATTAPVGTPAPVTAPRPGSYRYRYTSDGTPTEITIRFEDRSSLPGTRVIAQTQPRQGAEFITELSWGTSEIRTLKTTVVAQEMRGECDWQPDYLEAVVDMKAGREWTSESACDLVGLGPAVHTERKGKAKIVSAKRVQIAGAEAVVWVIQRRTETISSGDSTVSDATDWYSPERGLVLKRVETITVEGTTTKAELEILALDPT